MFYPQLVAGPIERPQGLLEQLKTNPKTTSEDLYNGLLLMLWGFFKKLCIADRLADFVNQVYQHPGKNSSTEIILAILFFSIQIYCDFSAYSDIAIGAARTMGFKLNTNFNKPYSASSFTNFWQRWHISLSSWFRDYLYIPLGGNRVSKPRQIINLMITFTVSGLWHGANFTYIIWGFLHGVLVSLEKLFNPNLKKRFSQIVYAAFVFICVNILWVFFRADSVGKALQILRLSVTKFKGGIPFGGGFEKVTSLAVIPFLLLIMFYFERKGDNHPLLHFTQGKSSLYQMTFILGFILMILWFGAFITPSTFIYFQFHIDLNP
ncbi:MAG: MBOAT family protein [Bacteroidetes bacterium]|nr:MBOAT family protein [Bacteroidota bacterium]